MPLGSAKTRQFNLGTSELRVAPLTSAGRLLPAHSVGLVDSTTVNVAQEAARLEGGFPRKLIDTAVVSQTASVTAQLREVSRRNLQVLLGQGVSAGNPVDVATTLSVAAAAAATSITVTAATGIAAGDTLVVFPKGKPEFLSIVVVTGLAANVVTLSSQTPLLHAYDPALGPVEVFNAHPIPLGAVDSVQYFAVQVIQRNYANGRPRSFDFWKAAISSGMTYETSSQDYGTNELQIEIMEPTAEDIAAGGGLVHISDIIANHPAGRMSFGA